MDSIYFLASSKAMDSSRTGGASRSGSVIVIFGEEMLDKGVGIGETGWGTHCLAKQETENTKDVTKQKDMVLKKLAVHLIEKPPLHKCR